VTAVFAFFLLMLRLPPSSTLFPYTTLFRSYVTHPFTGERVPVWIADYVLVDYGTGAVMGVPAHDTRDFEFAQRFGLPVVEVVRPLQGDGAEAALPYVDDGVLVNSGPFAGLSSAEARRRITEALEEKGLG